MPTALNVRAERLRSEAPQLTGFLSSPSFCLRLVLE